MKPKIIFILLVSAIAYLYIENNSSAKHLSAARLVNALRADQKTHSTITVYSLPGHPITYRAIETLKIYGFDSTLVPVRSMEEMKTIPNLPQDMTTLPIFQLPYDGVVSADAFFSAVTQLPVVDFHEGKAHPYLIVYGIDNCAYTTAAKEALNQYGIPYEYIDLNADAPRYMGEVEARLKASGYQETRYQTPIIEVNGYMRPRLDIDTIIEKYNAP